MRFDSVATVESPANGTEPDIDSSRVRHNEYTSPFGPSPTALGELRRGVHRQRVADVRPVGPQRLTDDVGETDVGDPQSIVVTEHQRRRTDVAVDETVTMDDVERLAGLETDHQRLRRRQGAAAVEVLAQASATEVLDDDVHRLALVPRVGTPVVDLGDVRDA